MLLKYFKMDDMNKTDFASAMFRKGSNTVELMFAERFNRKPSLNSAVYIADNRLVNLLLYSYLLGVCSCLTDQASFLELRQAIDNVWL